MTQVIIIDNQEPTEMTALMNQVARKMTGLNLTFSRPVNLAMAYDELLTAIAKMNAPTGQVESCKAVYDKLADQMASKLRLYAKEDNQDQRIISKMVALKNAKIPKEVIYKILEKLA